MVGTLYIVGTPIGNLQDITFRAVETLKTVDFIAAEDTRVTIKLLNHFDIKKPMVSYHEHNIRERGEEILARVLEGESVAIVTDAGMPCISDPGEDIVRLCYEKNIPVKIIPGPSAVISALCLSGLDTSRFSFQGFLSTNKTNRAEHLSKVINYPETLVFYEGPHKLVGTLEDMLKHLGDRRISVCHELTKIHESVLRTTISEAIEYYSQKKPKGEFVLIIEGKEPEKEASLTIEDAISFAKDLVAKGVKSSEAAKEAARVMGFKKSEIYKGLL